MRIRKNPKDLIDDEILLMAKMSDALAHPLRIKLLRFIMAQNSKNIKVCNKDMVIEFGYAQATISQHLSIMSQANLLQKKKQDKSTYYFVNIGMLMKYINTVKTFE